MGAAAWLRTRFERCAPSGVGGRGADGIELVRDRLSAGEGPSGVWKEARSGPERRALEREVAALVELVHPALRRLLAHASEADRVVAVLEHVPGHDLAEHLRLRPDDALRLSVELLR